MPQALLSALKTSKRKGTNMSNDYQTPWSGQVALGGKAQRVAVGINTSAGQAVLYRLELFYIGSDGKLYHRLQDPKQPNGWGNPAILAGEAVGLAVTNLGDCMPIPSSPVRESHESLARVPRVPLDRIASHGAAISNR